VVAVPILLKGILAAEDARLAIDHGVDGIVVSNHGSRQLDRTITTADALEEVSRGRRWPARGLGRRRDPARPGRGHRAGPRRAGVLVGRPILYALAAAGRRA
jgi:isopentenyl diphosphate isomerase/L-lactate dehydrogenase-like FMN-dependent dehydrogenase